MHNLGWTRGRSARDHLLQTPDTFVRTPLPGLQNASAIVHIGDANGANFTQYTVEFASKGTLAPTCFQRFVYVLEGDVELHLSAHRDVLTPGSFAYMPANLDCSLHASTVSRAVIIEKTANPLDEGARSKLFVSHESAISAVPLPGDGDVEVYTLLPESGVGNFAVNLMVYQPGAALSMVEMHVMEHGLLMLEGGGIYRLSERWYPVAAGDFIWMAPFCPQWFGALGRRPAKYLIYKDWNEHPLPGLWRFQE